MKTEVTLPVGTEICKTQTTQHCAVMAYDGHHSLGNAEASNLGNGVWYLNRVKVRDGHYGKGIGAHILTLLKGLLKNSEGFGELVVEPGGYSNRTEDQIRFYESNGFKQIEDKHCWVWRPS